MFNDTSNNIFSMSLNRHIKSVKNLTVTEKCPIYLLSYKTCGKHTLVKQMKSLRVDGIITKRMLEKQLVVT